MRKGAVYKCLLEMVLDKGVEVRVLIAEAILMFETWTRSRHLCKVQVANAAFRLRKSQTGSQVDLVQLHVADAKKSF